MSDYLAQTLIFQKDRIITAEDGTQIMMSWEKPLMQKMAQLACLRGGDILEIGFGMGISAQHVQSFPIQTHTIIEAHPQIAEKAKEWAKDHPSATIIQARWQDVIQTLHLYHGILFDVFGGSGQREEFFSNLPKLLHPHGIATLWLADDKKLPTSIDKVLKNFGYRHQLHRVSAIPGPDCRYSQSNEFYIPAIFK